MTFDIKIKSMNEETVKFTWRRKVCSGADWKNKYARDDRDKYPILSITKEGGESKEIVFAYMAVGPSLDLQVTGMDDLRKIDLFLRARNRRPFVFEDAE